jgi:DNA-binding NarL/FixJ family response regulator
MARGTPKAVRVGAAVTRQLPMEAAVWDEIAASLKFSPQEKRIVAGILRGLRDKEIAAELGVGMPTIRTYLTRVFLKTGESDRMAIVLRLFAAAQQLASTPKRHGA